MEPLKYLGPCWDRSWDMAMLAMARSEIKTRAATDKPYFIVRNLQIECCGSTIGQV
jgi:hypothetical protein